MSPSAGTGDSAVLLRRRAGVVVSAVGIAWLILAGRLAQLQVVQRADLAERADRQRVATEDVPPRPGDIFDRHGRLLATTIRSQSLYVVPSQITKRWTFALQLATALHLDADRLFTQLSAHADQHFLWIRRRLAEDEVERVRAAGLPEEAYGFRDEYRRVYPQGPLAAQVLGLRDIDGRGRGGVEESCEALLGGQAGKRHLTRDARGRVIDVAADPEQPPTDGRPVTLTLDAVVQLFAERELDRLMREWKPESTCAIVMDPATGEVLAMASRPALDANALEQVDPEAWKNRAVADIYEPGSTFKPFVVAYGLERGVLQRDDEFHCEHGVYRMGRRLLHDHHRYGTLSLTDVLVKSSNIGMAKIGERLTNERLHAAATEFGFGRKTGIELPGELPGVLRPLEQWTSYSTGSIPMGHEIATTPLQLLTAHCALANGGHLLRPRLVRPPAGEDSFDAQQFRHTIVSPETARWVVSVPMRQVVTRGTGRKAQVEGYEVFGKTGTAQSLSPEGGYRHGKYISSFVCGAPLDQPRLMVLVVVNQAAVGGEAFGGRVAAPAAAEILRQSLLYLRVAPQDDAPQTADPGRAARRH